MEAESNEPALLLPAAGCPSAASAAVYQESRMRRYSTAHPSSKSTRKCEARRRLVATIVRLHTTRLSEHNPEAMHVADTPRWISLCPRDTAYDLEASGSGREEDWTPTNIAWATQATPFSTAQLKQHKLSRALFLCHFMNLYVYHSTSPPRCLCRCSSVCLSRNLKLAEDSLGGGDL